MLIAAVGFILTALMVNLLAKEKEKLLAQGGEAQHSTAESPLVEIPSTAHPAVPLAPTCCCWRCSLLLMTWISTIVYFQLGDLITKAFDSKEARTQAYATIDLTVNSLAVLVQLFGTGRIIQRFGVQTGLLLNPFIMVVAFLAVAFSPGTHDPGWHPDRASRGRVRRRETDPRDVVYRRRQESKYKAKNVIDTVVYRFGDFSSAWDECGRAAVRSDGSRHLRCDHFDSVVPIAYLLGKRYESVRAGDLVDERRQPAASGHG